MVNTGHVNIHVSQEEILDCDLDVDDDGEMSEDLEEAEAGDMNPDNLEGTTDEDENNGQQEVEEADVNSEGEIEIEQPEVGTVEDNSSEPSSSTGTRRSTIAGAQVIISTNQQLVTLYILSRDPESLAMSMTRETQIV